MGRILECGEFVTLHVEVGPENMSLVKSFCSSCRPGDISVLTCKFYNRVLSGGDMTSQALTANPDREP